MKRSVEVELIDVVRLALGVEELLDATGHGRAYLSDQTSLAGRIGLAFR